VSRGKSSAADFARRRLGAAAGGAEQRQVVGEAGERAALFALFQNREHLLRAGRYGLR
jgi:hypothetical protein